MQAEGSDYTHTWWESRNQSVNRRGEDEESRGHDSDHGTTTFPALLAVALRNLEPNRWENIQLYSATPHKTREEEEEEDDLAFELLFSGLNQN